MDRDTPHRGSNNLTHSIPYILIMRCGLEKEVRGIGQSLGLV